MKNKTFVLEKIILFLLFSLYSNIYGKELNIDTNVAKSRGHHVGMPRGGRTRIRINIAPIYNDYDFEYREDYSGCIPYYFHYGFPPSAFNFGLRVPSSRTYYYCPNGYYYKKSKYQDSRYKYIDKGRIRYRH